MYELVYTNEEYIADLQDLMEIELEAAELDKISLVNQEGVVGLVKDKYQNLRAKLNDKIISLGNKVSGIMDETEKAKKNIDELYKDIEKNRKELLDQHIYITTFDGNEAANLFKNITNIMKRLHSLMGDVDINSLDDIARRKKEITDLINRYANKKYLVKKDFSTTPKQAYKIYKDYIHDLNKNLENLQSDLKFFKENLQRHYDKKDQYQEKDFFKRDVSIDTFRISATSRIIKLTEFAVNLVTSSTYKALRSAAIAKGN